MKVVKARLKKRDEIYRQDLLNELSARYYSKSDIPIRIHINGPFLKHHIDHILDYLLKTDFVEQRQVKHDLVIDGTKTRLYVQRLPSSFANYRRWVYMSDTIGWVGRIKDDDVEKIVKGKSLNINKYKKNIERVSLLIVSNRIKNSGKLHLEKNQNINTYGFHKVYFYMHPLEAIVYVSERGHR